MRRIKCLILAVAALVLILYLPSWGMEMTRKFSVGLDGGFYKPMLTDYDIWTVGYHGTFTFKYGIKENLALGFMGKYAKTWEAKLETPDEDAGFTFDKKTDGWENLEYLGEAAIYYFFNPENEKYTPYIFGGGGLAFWKWEETFDTDTTEPVTRVVRWPAKKGSGADSVKLEDQEVTLVFGAGVEYYPKENLGVNLGARVRYFTRLLSGFINEKDIVGTNEEQGELDLPRASPEIYLGVSYYFGKPKDTDEDGVADKVDQCPDTPLGAMVDENGCPLDSDGDGVYDGLDNCADTPKGAIVDVNGCPMDSDGDGVFDGIDKCADTPSGWPVDSKGCPLDDDGDGVPNPEDNEADTPAGAVVDKNGIGIDSDNDGIYDGLDKCPGTYVGIPVDKDGCPLIKPIEPKIVLHPAYPSGSVILDDETKSFLDDLAERLMAYKTVRIEVRGYTDSWGTPEGNKYISQRRADVIKKYLVAKGVEEERIEVKGYGATDFIADNETAEGRAKNRRIEIVTIP